MSQRKALLARLPPALKADQQSVSISRTSCLRSSSSCSPSFEYANLREGGFTETVSSSRAVATLKVRDADSSNSAQIFTEAQDLLPGGVNSPVRAFKSVGGQPIVFDRVQGPYAYDVDGNKYSAS